MKGYSKSLVVHFSVIISLIKAFFSSFGLSSSHRSARIQFRLLAFIMNWETINCVVRKALWGRVDQISFILSADFDVSRKPI